MCIGTAYYGIYNTLLNYVKQQLVYVFNIYCTIKEKESYIIK